MGKTTTSIRCSACEAGKLEDRVITHDVSDLLGLKKVVVTNLPALVCSKCGAVSMYGHAIDEVSLLVAAQILRQSSLKPAEVRFLRKLMGFTQDELAERLDVVRATVNRWETAKDEVSGPPAYTIRSFAFFRLRDRSPAIEQTAPAFVEPERAARKKAAGYTIEGASVSAHP